MGYISSAPLDVRVEGDVKKMVQINFLCIHPSQRSTGLAQLLISEIKRLTNNKGIWQAVATAVAMAAVVRAAAATVGGEPAEGGLGAGAKAVEVTAAGATEGAGPGSVAYRQAGTQAAGVVGAVKQHEWSVRNRGAA